MLRSIEINRQFFRKRIKDKQTNAFRNGTQDNPFFHQENHLYFNQQQKQQTPIPIKQYSNKFLRESNANVGWKENQKKQPNVRLNSIIKKHKVLQKKYNKIISRRDFICKTEPNQTEYQCFMTFSNLDRVSHVRAKTESMAPTKALNQTFFDRIIKKSAQQSASLQKNCPAIKKEPQVQVNCAQVLKVSNENAFKGRHFSLPVDQKISTSRALEIYSKVICKDKGEKYQKTKLCNQNKLIKEKILESNKNLEAKHIVLFQKQKKYSIAEKGEKIFTIRAPNIKRKKYNSSMNQLALEDDNFELKGWEASN